MNVFNKMGITTIIIFWAVSGKSQSQDLMVIQDFKIIGIAKRTINLNWKSEQDIGDLWSRFFGENLMDSIPNKIGQEILSVYSDYQTDYMGEYTCIIGMKVSTLDSIPDGMVGIKIKSGHYRRFTATGEMPNAVAKKWKSIWESDHLLNRAYKTDFEVYGPLSNNGEESEVHIYLSVN